ncbi:MAG: hypothetical protein H6730_31335 [Deltaproteobacteria bacterium]|nr:hypothetical protein [Deltaproteobacteria bacterium]
MKLEADARITFPRELVYSTYRDRLPELVPFLPNVKGISVQTRSDDADGKPGVTKLLNLWEAKGEIPKMAQGIIKPEMLAWLDYATWDQNAWTCDWRIETRMFTENVKCFGHNTYEVDGEDTILKIRGELDVSLTGIPGVPKFLAGKVAPHVEKFIVGLLTPNLLSVAKGLEDFLKSQS